MELLVTVERRYIEYNKDFYVKGIEDTCFFERYLDDFDKVTVLARVSKLKSLPEGFKLIRSDKIAIKPIYTNGYGIFDFLYFYKVIKQFRQGAIIIRTPGILAYAFSMYCFFIKKKFSLEVVTNPREEAVNTTNSKVVNKILYVIFPKIFKFQLNSCRFASFVTKKAIQQQFLGYEDCLTEKFNSSYSSINLNSSFYNNNIQKKMKFYPTKEKITLLFVGVLDRNFKGLDIFLKIVSLLPERYNGIVVGDGILHDYYQNMAQELGIYERVIFKGYVANENEKKNIYTQSDIFLLTSRREGLPRVVIEAMANALPCICSDVSGIRELIDEKYIYPINDVSKACLLINNLSLQEIEQQARKNFAKAKEYSIDDLHPKRRHFYKKIIEDQIQ